MSDQTNIEWADSTFNPWLGCTKISPACQNCYAEAMMDSRLGRVQWGAGKPRVRTSAENWRKPLRWNKRADEFGQCNKCGWRGQQNPRWSIVCPACDNGLMQPARRRVFCASLADVFDNEVDPQWREDLFALIRATPNLDWLILTKRVGNVPAMVSVIPGWMPPNVWIGATICNQEEADRDIPKLLAIPAAVRFVSIEPMLGPVDLTRVHRTQKGDEWTYVDNVLTGFRAHKCGGHVSPKNAIDWVICGGESGPNARPMHPGWARSLRDQCVAAGVPFLFKQWGHFLPSGQVDDNGDEWTPVSTRQTPAKDSGFRAIGKRNAGRRLDGRTWDQFPEPHHG